MSPPQRPDEETIQFYQRLLSAPSTERSRMIGSVLAIDLSLGMKEKAARNRLAVSLASAHTFLGSEDHKTSRAVVKLIKEIRSGCFAPCSCFSPSPKTTSIFGDSTRPTRR